ncbi:MAG: molybdopterin cofactor-binding domain-containing protein, partial [Rhodovibrionaceae bacterium]|nr:molybdopterin cofactor-binding domain-containing protein [Rhodovibrionaceae bacterium]
TNTVPVDAYRGAGRPEASYLVERLIDYVAGEVGLSPPDFRKRNFIRPDDLPYDTGLGITYDSGDFQHIMETAMENIDWAGADSRKDASRKAGRYRGLGLACYVEACAGIGEEEAKVEVTPAGEIDLVVGTQSNGQGHHTAYAQILSDKLGLPIETVRLRQGDSDSLTKAGGTAGSRSLLMGGQATTVASDLLIEKARKIAGFMLETAEADLEFEEGVFSVVGTDKRVSLVDVAKAANERDDLPDDLKGPLAAEGTYKAEAMTFPNGCHACELEIDAETGEVAILRYVVVDDFGRLVNPLLVAGQIHGGTAQGLGQALLERTVYDTESGQLLTGSYMDYCLPRADDMPQIELTFENVPCTTNPMGIKGSGEAGAIGAPPAIINALVDALRPLGVRHIDMPATTEKLWRIMQDARAGERQAAE